MGTRVKKPTKTATRILWSLGLTNTKIHKKISGKKLSKRTKLVPVKKMAHPKDIANYIYHIASNENQFITGQVINITGGE